ncbi:GNAT family N-acetyltransferase [Roseomonas nepalensis]|uniref:GNAT family N-acetyltransferase n=1 Tax=Muricoccus nepalensis TaxID=1854500 RepID=A0A502GGW0_9PROT|nr:GNAT family N-acetyltransferase [Roseomonas nepalensis]TPG61379.1 GNAT family N-acetyltransferase [Roseomonas nepalensis]
MTTRTARTPGEAARLRPLAEADLPAAQALTAALRWPHRVEDWAFALALGQGLAAEIDGRLAGTAMAWRYGARAGALGFVVVADAAQGRGLGRALTEGVLAFLGERSVTLCATDIGRPLYASLGFAGTGRVHQHGGSSFSAGLVALPPGQRLRPAGRRDTPALAALDARALGVPRDALMRALLPVADGVVLDRDGEAIGFSLIRRFGHGQVIGPVVAPDAAGARALIAHWLGSRPGQFIRIDVPGASGLSPWLEALGVAQVGGGEVMVRGAPPRGDSTRFSFALVSQALG